MSLHREFRYKLQEINENLAENEDLPAKNSEGPTPNALDQKDKTIEKVLEQLLQCRVQTAFPLKNTDFNSSQLLVLAAESAIKSKKFDIAEKAILEYLKDKAPFDQFHCRAKFVQAYCVSSKFIKLKGIQRVEQIQKGIRYILDALEISLLPENSPQYHFLTYNASVHYWHIVRPIMKPGTYSYIMDSTTKITEALHSIHLNSSVDSNLWLIRYYIVLALGHDDAENYSKAALSAMEARKIMDNLIEMNNFVENGFDLTTSVKQFQEELLCIQVYISRNKDNNADCTKLLDSAKKAATSSERSMHIFRLQCIKAGIISESDALEVEFDKLYTDLVESASDPEHIIDLGMEAIQKNRTRLANNCLENVIRIKKIPPLASIQKDILHAFIMCSGNEGDDSSDSVEFSKKKSQRQLEGVRLAQRSQAMKVLERAILACKRLGNANVIQKACILGWNLGLSLLESHSRMHVHKLFQTSSSVLEELKSEALLSLRACLHFEVAKCEMSCDFLAKATSHLKKAVDLDYGGKNGNRFLDHYLNPIYSTLKLKGDLYKEPNDFVEQSIILVEQIKDSNEDYIKRNLLSRIFLVLESNNVELIFEGKLDDRHYKIIALWLDVTEISWQIKNIEFAQKGANIILKQKWSSNYLPKDYIIRQANTHFTLALTYVEQVEVLSQRYNSGAKAKENNETKDEMISLRCNVVKEFVAGIRIGVEINEVWLVENGVIYLINFHLNITRCMFEWSPELGDFPDIVERNSSLFEHIKSSTPYLEDEIVLDDLKKGLEYGFESLLKTYTKDFNLVSQTGENLMRLYAMKKDFENIEKLSKQISRYKTANLRYLSSYTEMQMKEIIEWEVIGREKKKTPNPKGEVAIVLDEIGEIVEHKIISLVQLLEMCTFSDEKRKQVVEKAMLLIDKISLHDDNKLKKLSLEKFVSMIELNCECCTRLARGCLEMNLLEYCQKCCILSLSSVQFFSHAGDSIMKGNAKIPKVIARWYSISECLWGMCILKHIQTEGQSLSVRNQFRVYSFDHFVLSAEYSIIADNNVLLFCAMKTFWNASIEMLKVKHSRLQVFPYLKNIILHFEKAKSIVLSKNANDINTVFIVNLYCCILECYFDVQEFKAGISCIDKAFTFIPKSSQKLLWEFRVIFMSKLGLSIQQGISKMKENDPILQAKIWSTIILSSTDISEQFKAFKRIFAILKSVPYQLVEYYLQFSQWLLCNNFPKQDVIDQLINSMDVVYEEQTNLLSSSEISPIQYSYFEKLIRINIMTALAEDSHNKRLESAILATCYVKKLWQKIIDSYNRNEYSKLDEVDQKNMDFSSWWEKENEISNNPRFLYYPNNIEGWLRFNGFELSGANEKSNLTLHALRNGILRWDRNTIPKPSLTLHYLFQLLEVLNSYKIDTYSFEILSLLKCLSHWLEFEKIISTQASSVLNSVLNLKIGRLLETVGATCLYEEVIKLNGGEFSFFLTNECNIEFRKTDFSPEEISFIFLLHKKAEVLYDLGYIPSSKQIINIIQDIIQKKNAENDKNNTCNSCEDSTFGADSHFILGSIALEEGQIDKSLSHLLCALEYADIHVSKWMKYVKSALSVFLQEDRFQDGKKLLDCCLSSILKQYPNILHDQNATNSDLDVCEAFCSLNFEYGNLLASECLKNCKRGREFRTVWNNAVSYFEKGLVSYRKIGRSIELVKSLMRYAQAILDLREREDPFILEKEVQKQALNEAMDLLKEANDYATEIYNIVYPDILPNSISAISLLIAEINFGMGSISVRLLDEQKEAEMKYYFEESRAQMTLVDIWLEETAAEKVPTAEEIQLPFEQKAVIYFSTAEHLLNSTRTLQSLSYILSNSLSNESNNMKSGTVLEPTDFNTQATEEGQQPVTQQSVYRDMLTQRLQEVSTADSSRYLNPEVSKWTIYSTLDSNCRWLEDNELCTITFQMMLVTWRNDKIDEAVKYLMWYQSCKASLFLADTFGVSASKSNRQFLFVQRLKSLCKKSQRNSVFGRNCQLFLESQSETWRRICCGLTIDSAISTLPGSYFIICLQTSKDLRYLYLGIHSKESDSVFDCMELHTKKRKELQSLLERMRNRVLSHSSLMSELDKDLFSEDAECVENDTFDDVISGIIIELDNFIKPLLGSDAVTSQLTSISDKGVNVVLLVDTVLQVLPFESTSFFQNLDSISRDFSIHCLSNRSRACKATAWRKSDMIYVIDPRNEDGDRKKGKLSKETQTNRSSTIEVMKSLLDSGIGSWIQNGLKFNHIPSENEWQEFLESRRGGGLLFYGPGRAFSYFMPNRLAALNASKCNVVILIDRANNEVSQRRQSKIDNELYTPDFKSFWLEHHHSAIAALFTLAGVNALVLNQWNTSFQGNQLFITNFLQYLTRGQPIGKACQKSYIGDERKKVKEDIPKRIKFNTILYGIPHISFKSSD